MSKCCQRALSVALGILLTACGSLTVRDRNQFVLIQSSPPGADIFYQGKKVGVTPAFVEIRRSKNASVQLIDGHSVVNVPIETTYRWDGSFWPNFVFLYFAPAGWFVDYGTGSSWNFADPTIPRLQYLTPHPRTHMLGAIAPPQAASIELSDEGALLWEQHLKTRYPNLEIIPYQAKLDEFTSHGYDFDSNPGARTEHELFGRLSVDEVFESESRETETGIELRGHFRNVFTGAKGPEEIVHAAPSPENMTFLEKFNSFVHLVPNTVGLEYNFQSETQLSQNNTTYHSQSTHGSDFISQAAPYLSAIALTRQTPPRREAAGKFRFEFVPAVRASYRQMTFPAFTPIAQNEFTYLTIGAGIGPEGGWQWGPNYIYANLIPIFGWHRLAWRTEEGLSIYDVGAITLRSEIGYLYFLTDNFSFRFFGKNTSTPSSIWNRAVQDIAPGSPDVTAGTDFSAGFTFGFTWEPKREIHKWKISN
jgi:hypothetical protein